jgi:hypothetical protein
MRIRCAVPLLHERMGGKGIKFGSHEEFSFVRTATWHTESENQPIKHLGQRVGTRSTSWTAWSTEIDIQY